MVFITIEGIDGCGKGTVITKLTQELFDLNKNNHIYLTREPYDRNWLDEYFSKPNVDKRGEEAMKLFVQDRLKHCEIIKQLPNNNIILTDRYKHSTYAYQMAQEMSFETIHELHKQTLIPDLTIIIDVPAEEAIKRINKNRNINDGFEKQEFLTKVRQNYLKLKEKLNENTVIINGNREKEEVFQDVKKIVIEFLSKI